MSGRVMAVDPGDRRIGIALSDPTATIANPLQVLQHTARVVDAAAIVGLAVEHRAELIIVGQSLDEDGNPTSQGRKAARLAEAIRTQGDIPVRLWDEGGSTLAARQARRVMGANRRQRSGHLDELAATVILQSYLDHSARSGK